MNKFFLWIVMLPSGLWKGMGADTGQLRAMLNAKLLIDDRRPLSFGRQRKKKRDRKFALALNMFFSFIMGIFYMLPLLIIKNTLFSLWASYTSFLFILTLLLITDFANILFDTKDKYVLLHRPVNDRTLFLARMLHILIYLFRVVLPMSLPAWITMGILFGWKAAVFYPIPLFLLMFMTLFFVNGCYLLILRFSSPQRFKEVINYFQIIFAIFLFAFSYLMPRILQSSILQNIDVTKFTWAKYTPSYWLASLWIWILPATEAIAYTKLISFVAILLPLLLLWVTIKWIAPNFIRSLAAIDGVDASPVRNVKTETSKSAFYKKIADLVNKSSAAKAGFIITWLQTSRSRSFKMKVYPTFAYVPIYFVYLLTLNKHSLSNVFSSLSESSYNLGLMYMCSFIMLQALNYYTISDQYKASWVYYASPVEKPGNVMIGGFKAIYIKYFLPFFGAVSIFVIAVWGLPAILDVILALVNVTLFAACIMRVGFRRLPFSVMDQMENSGSRTIKVLVSLVVPFGLGFGHWAALHIWWLKVLFLVLSAILLWLVADSYSNTDWSNMRKEEL